MTSSNLHVDVINVRTLKEFCSLICSRKYSIEQNVIICTIQDYSRRIKKPSNFFYRSGYYKTFNETETQRIWCSKFSHVKRLFRCPNTLDDTTVFFPIVIDNDKKAKVVYIELIDQETESVNFIVLRSRSFLNPFRYTDEKYYEYHLVPTEPCRSTDVNLDESAVDIGDILQILNAGNINIDGYDVVGKKTSNDKTDSVNVGKNQAEDDYNYDNGTNNKFKNTKLHELGHTSTPCDQFVWIKEVNQNKDVNCILGFIWLNEKHWKTVYKRFGEYKLDNAWPITDIFEIKQLRLQLRQVMLMSFLNNMQTTNYKSKLDLPLEIRNQILPSNKLSKLYTLLSLSREHMVQICLNVVREVLFDENLESIQNPANVRIFGVNDLFLQISYDGIYSDYICSDPLDIINNQYLHKLFGLDNFIMTIIKWIFPKYKNNPSNNHSDRFWAKIQIINMYTAEQGLKKSNDHCIINITVCGQEKNTIKLCHTHHQTDHNFVARVNTILKTTQSLHQLDKCNLNDDIIENNLEKQLMEILENELCECETTIFFIDEMMFIFSDYLPKKTYIYGPITDFGPYGTNTVQLLIDKMSKYSSYNMLVRNKTNL